MAGEGEGAQTTTGAPDTTAQPQGAAAPAEGSTLLSAGVTASNGTEGKTATAGGEGDGQKPADKTGDEGGEKAADKPVEYTDFKMPEGMAIDEAALGEFKPIAQELKLNQDQAQKLVDLYAQQQAKQAQAWADQVKDWEATTRADKEIGGAKFDENLKVAQLAISAFASPQFIDLLTETGVGNHPEMVRFCMKVGAALGEDKAVNPGSGQGRQLTLEERMYPTMKS